MKARRLPASVYTGLKAATRAMVRDGFGTQAAAASATRVGQGQISDYCSTAPEQAETFMPVDILADLVAESGETALLKALAESANCLLVPLPVGHTAGLVAERTGRSATEFGQMMERVGTALRDGRIVEREARSILAEIRDVMVELSALAEAVKAATEREDSR